MFSCCIITYLLFYCWCELIILYSFYWATGPPPPASGAPPPVGYPGGGLQTTRLGGRRSRTSSMARGWWSSFASSTSKDAFFPDYLITSLDPQLRITASGQGPSRFDSHPPYYNSHHPFVKPLRVGWICGLFVLQATCARHQWGWRPPPRMTRTSAVTGKVTQRCPRSSLQVALPSP